MSQRRLVRRQFLKHSLAATAAGSLASPLFAAPAVVRRRGNNERLNLGVIGVAARGGANLKGVSSENIAALADIDQQRLAGAAELFPMTKQYVDYRKLLDQKDLDAVVVSTPDHSHAIPVVWALKHGLDVYCEKPLAHSVHETREMRNWAAKQKAVTQMGTQIHAEDNYRRVVEMVRSGAIGPVERVHVVNNGSVIPGRRVKQGTPPAHVDYDLWTGPAPLRPYDPSHFHFNWRYWWDYGNGALGDFGCHYMDLPFWALDLRYPTSVEARGEKTYEGDNEVPDNMQVDYRFPSRGELPAVHLTWWHGKWRPEGVDTLGKKSAVVFIGSKGTLVADYRTRQATLLDGSSLAPTPESIPASVGHHIEWIEACKSRGPTLCNFDYSGALTEAVLLGNVAYRVGEALQWDAEALRATNCSAADEFIRREYRQGWTL